MIDYLKNLKKILREKAPSHEEVDEITKDTQIRLLSALVLLLFLFLLSTKLIEQIKADTFEEFAAFSTTYEEIEDEPNTVSDDEKIDINSNDIFELTKIPGIGTAKAQAIIEYRKENGDFDYLEEIKYVKGIGDKIFEGMKNYIYIASEEASSETST